MPQPSTHKRKPPAGAAGPSKVKKGTNQLKTKSRKKKQTKNRGRATPSDESSSDEKTPPRKRQRKALEAEEVSVENITSEDEPEVVPIDDTSDADDSHGGDDPETIENVRETVILISPS